MIGRMEFARAAEILLRKMQNGRATADDRVNYGFCSLMLGRFQDAASVVPGLIQAYGPELKGAGKRVIKFAAIAAAAGIWMTAPACRRSGGDSDLVKFERGKMILELYNQQKAASRAGGNSQSWPIELKYGIVSPPISLKYGVVIYPLYSISQALYAIAVRPGEPAKP